MSTIDSKAPAPPTSDRPEPGALPRLESRSIDYIPLAERHGKVWHLGPVWLMGTAHIATVAIGLIGIASGANLFWSLAAIVLGAMFGTFFSAFHSTQGPQLGLPQMIQSRPQFGYQGALVVWVFVFISYAGYNVFNNLLAGDSLNNTVGIDAKAGFFVITALAVALAMAGYDLIHRTTRWFTPLFLIVYAVFTLAAIFTLDLPAGALDAGQFDWTPFLIQFAVTAGYLISWAPYVSDYSRYLPPNVGVRASFAWTYLGMAVGAIWLLSLGALIAAAFPELGVIEAMRAAGDSVFNGFGTIALLVALPGLVTVMALNLYGGSLTLLTIVETLKRFTPTVTARLAGVAVVAAIGLVLALIASDDFLTDFTTFLTILLYMFAPWTAINLVDFYLVRKARYSIREIFNPRGMYGRWSWRGIGAYVIGLAAMVPFNATTLYTGPVAEELGGADLSVFIGIPVAAVAYYAFTRSLDLADERRLIAQRDTGLEDRPSEPDRSAGRPAAS